MIWNSSWVKLVKALVWTFVLLILGMVISWVVIWIQSNQIVNDRINDLIQIATEENCISNDATTGSVADNYEELLESSETYWLKFNTTKDSVGYTSYTNGLCYFVGKTDGSREYRSYLDAPQRGTPIKVKLKGTVNLPLMINKKDVPSFTLNIEKEFVTLGNKVYKDR